MKRREFVTLLGGTAGRGHSGRARSKPNRQAFDVDRTSAKHRLILPEVSGF